MTAPQGRPPEGPGTLRLTPAQDEGSDEGAGEGLEQRPALAAGADFAEAVRRLRQRAEEHGVRVKTERLGPDTPGTFDGPSITLNEAYTPDESYYYLAHALGSIVRWSLDPDTWRAMFEELDAAKANRGADAERLERAVERYRAYEDGASEYAVWLLQDLDMGALVPHYTNFGRADVESMAEYHRTGRQPAWHEFFARWNEEVARGERPVRPYTPRPVPPFRPAPMRPQTIQQENDATA